MLAMTWNERMRATACLVAKVCCVPSFYVHFTSFVNLKLSSLQFVLPSEKVTYQNMCISLSPNSCRIYRVEPNCLTFYYSNIAAFNLLWMCRCDIAWWSLFVAIHLNSGFICSRVCQFSVKLLTLNCHDTKWSERHSVSLSSSCSIASHFFLIHQLKLVDFSILNDSFSFQCFFFVSFFIFLLHLISFIRVFFDFCQDVATCGLNNRKLNYVPT